MGNLPLSPIKTLLDKEQHLIFSICKSPSYQTRYSLTFLHLSLSFSDHPNPTVLFLSLHYQNTSIRHTFSHPTHYPLHRRASQIFRILKFDLLQAQLVSGQSSVKHFVYRLRQGSLPWMSCL